MAAIFAEVTGVVFPVQARDDKPVWRQLLQYLLAHRDPGVADQAAAAVVE